MDKPNSVDKTIATLKNLPVPQGPSAELVDKTLAGMETAVSPDPDGQVSRWTRLRAYGKLSIAAAILIGMGFLAGRQNNASPLSEQQLQALEHSLLSSLEPTLAAHVRDQLTADWQRALVFTYGKVMHEVDQQVDHKINQFAFQVLAVSHVKTELALGTLVDQIRQNEVHQQARFARALNQLEYNHLVRDSQVRNSLATFADLTQTHVKHTEDLISFVVHELGPARDPNNVNPQLKRN